VLVIVEGCVELAVTTGRRRVTVVDPGALHSFRGLPSTPLTRPKRRLAPTNRPHASLLKGHGSPALARCGWRGLALFCAMRSRNGSGIPYGSPARVGYRLGQALEMP
jgi:hypothetical protein